MPSDSPLVSVLMPVYNGEPYLDEAIDSIRAQTLTDFQFVIVNDGSTDNSLAVLQRHAAEDKRLEVIDRSNRGIVSALNAGLAACRGELVARMDADDISDPKRFALQNEYLKHHPEVGAVGSAASLIDADGAVLRLQDYPLLHDAIDRMAINDGVCGLLHPTVMMRRSLAAELEGYSDRFPFAEDYDFFLRAAEVMKLANLPQPLLSWRRHSESICAKHRAQQARSVYCAVLTTEHRRKQAYHRQRVRHAYRASWASSNEGRHADGVRYALQCFGQQPFSGTGVRALSRACLKWLTDLFSFATGRSRDPGGLERKTS